MLKVGRSGWQNLEVGELESNGRQQDGVGRRDGDVSLLLQLRVVPEAGHVARPSAPGRNDRASEQPGHYVVPGRSGYHIDQT